MFLSTSTGGAASRLMTNVAPPLEDVRRHSSALQTLRTRAFLAEGADPSVQRLVRYYSTNARGRATFDAWMKRAALYAPMIDEVLRSYGLPRELLAVAIVESALDPQAVSSAGATGLWQFMATTGRNYGLKITDEIDERRQPRLATDAAARHLRDLRDSLGDWPRALAAYNAGEERIRGISDEVGSTDFWVIRERSERLPEETSNYVPRVYAVAHLVEDWLARDFATDFGAEVVEVSAPPGISLDAVAVALGMKRAELGRLNPELVSRRVPTLEGRQVLRVPRDRETLAAILLQPRVERPTELDRQIVTRVVAFGGAVRAVRPERRAPDSAQHEDARWERLSSALNGAVRQTYSVKRGDSLQKISRLFGVDEQRLKEANAVKDPRSMPIGMVLVVPSDS